MKYLLYTMLFFSVLLFYACEDVIEVDSGFENPTLVVDAWLDNLDRPQTVRLTMSQDYFDDSFAEAIQEAEVIVTVNQNKIITFINNGNGNYVYTPQSGERMGEVGDIFRLSILLDGVEYTATNVMKRVPAIDSIAVVYEEETLVFPEGNYAELFAVDFPGTGDTYWAKTWKNGEYLNKPEEILLIYDATFDAGSGLDGTEFIFPIRRGINPLQDEPEDEEELQPPYLPGDSIYVELHSISNDGFRFMQIAFEQMTNGDNGIFSLPVANTKSNVVNQVTNQPILGFFNVSAVSTASKKVK